MARHTPPLHSDDEADDETEPGRSDHSDEADPVVTFLQQSQLRFSDIALLRQALTHPSFRNEHPDVTSDNERMEFLGDAVIDFVASELLFLRYPHLPEGDLTRLRALLVRTDSLAALGMRIGVSGALRMGRGEEASGGRQRSNNVCAAFEAVMGALFLDQGMEAVSRYTTPLLVERLDALDAAPIDLDARSELQEFAQAHLGNTPRYDVVGQTGPDHEKVWTVIVRIGDSVAGQGVGRSKQAASQSAAGDALEKLKGAQKSD
ncbi:MAG: ribonuclease III [Chloroflexi bacterium]|nr:ribonuclease III [Chloroflexota bacterium]